MALVTSDYVVKIDYNFNSDFGTSADEVDAYDFVCREGYDKYFAEISCYTYGGLDFYIMPRVGGIGRKWGDTTFTITTTDGKTIMLLSLTTRRGCYNLRYIMSAGPLEITYII